MKTLSATDTLHAAPENAVVYSILSNADAVRHLSDGSFDPPQLTWLVLKSDGSTVTRLETLSACTAEGLVPQYKRSSDTDIQKIQTTLLHTMMEGLTDIALYVYKSGVCVAEKVVKVVCDGKTGAAGASGPIPYPCGSYDSTVSYTRTAYMAPVVGSGSLFYLQLKVGTIKGINPQTDVANNGGNWAVFDMFKYLMSEVAFINFGKLASAIFYGQYMFSQYGVNASDVAVETVDGYKNFNSSDPMNESNAFRPNILIDFLSGKMYGREIHLSGNSSIDGKVTLRALYRHILTGGDGRYTNLAEGSGFELHGDYVVPILQTDTFTELIGLNLSPETRSIQGYGEIYFPNSNNVVHYNGYTYSKVSTLSYSHSGGYIKVTMIGRGYDDYGQCWIVEVDSDSDFEFTVNLVS